MHTNTLIADLQAFAAERRWRPSRLAKEAGLHPNTLRHFKLPTWNPTLDTLRRLESLIERAA